MPAAPGASMARGSGVRAEETELSTSSERTVALRGRPVPIVVIAGLIALAAAWLGIVYFAEPWGRLAGSGMDARCYWAPDLANPYLHSTWTDQIAYPYSPIFLQILQPIRLLPWQAFMAVWAAILMASMVYLTGPRLILLGLAFFGLMEIWGGNIEMLVAVAVVLGFRWPATWSFVLLTKVTPGVGLLWFAVRREWRSLAIALAATVVVVVVARVVVVVGARAVVVVDFAVVVVVVAARAVVVVDLAVVVVAPGGVVVVEAGRVVDVVSGGLPAATHSARVGAAFRLG